MPTRSLHARGAGTQGDDFRLPGLGGITRFAQPDAGSPFQRRAWSVAATAGARVGMRGVRRVPASVIGAGRSADGSLHASGAVAPGDTCGRS
jgi:hypothetical protein